MLSARKDVVGISTRSWAQSRMKNRICFWLAVVFSFVVRAFLPSSDAVASPEKKPYALELSRPMHSSEFLCAVGQKSGVFGNESGVFEAWVYPLKLFRDFSLIFHVNDHDIPAAPLAKATVARPESTTIIYAGDTYRVSETILAPVHEPGVILRLEVETEEPLEVEAVFRRDFQLEWPAGLGATYANWDAAKHAFVFGEELKKYAALVGSPTGTVSAQEIETNYSSSPWSGIRLGKTAKGRETKFIFVAASSIGVTEAEATYKKLVEQHEALEQDSAEYYEEYLRRTVNLELPDKELQKAYDWSRVSEVQGLVSNAKYGTGLIAGYRTSGRTQRPGFAWFFGRDALWTSLALNSAGDFSSTKTALEFLTQFQREDGRIPHEIAQTGYLVDWFKNYPYGFAAADATPLYIIAVEDYVRSSGDVVFAQEHWNNVKKAYNFLHSTYGPVGLPKNFGVGHGWIEGGPFLPVQSELYQSGVGAAAIQSLALLAKWTGHDVEAKSLSEEFSIQKGKVNEAFWSEDRQFSGFALNQDNKIMPEATVLATVPMWFGVLDAGRSRKTITELASIHHATDWGMRIVSDKSPLYSGGGYHFGAVWPLFTGWAAVGEYNYHENHAAWQNLRANALLALDGSPGHVTEVLSGTYYEGLSAASPHQIWSAAMVVAPLLKGLFGMETDAVSHTLKFAPALPANWKALSLKNVRIADTSVGIQFQRTEEEMEVEVQRTGAGELSFEFQPALSLRAQVVAVNLNGRPVPFEVIPNDADQHLHVSFPVYGGPNVLRVQMRHDFSITYTPRLPCPGEPSEGLRVLKESWSSSRDQLTLSLEGTAGSSYELALFNGKEITGADGGTLKKKDHETESVLLTMPSGGEDSAHSVLVLQFAPRSAKRTH